MEYKINDIKVAFKGGPANTQFVVQLHFVERIE